MSDAWRWSPDMPEMDYVPVMYYDPPMAPWRKAPIVFQEGDPADAVAWLENKTGLGPDERLNHNMINVPVSSERQGAVFADDLTGVQWVSEEVMTPGVCSACGMPAERGPSGSWWHLQESCAQAMGAAATFQRTSDHDGCWHGNGSSCTTCNP